MLETRITKVYPRPVGWVVVLLVLLVDLEPKTWHISEKNQNAENIMDGQLKKRLIKENLLATIALSHGKERIVNKFRKQLVELLQKVVKVLK